MKFQRSNILEKIFQQCLYLHYIFLKNQHYAFISSCQHIQLLMYFLKKIISPMAYSSSQCQLLSYIVTGYRHQMLVVFIYITACRQSSHWKFTNTIVISVQKKEPFQFLLLDNRLSFHCTHILVIAYNDADILVSAYSISNLLTNMLVTPANILV